MRPHLQQYLVKNSVHKYKAHKHIRQRSHFALALCKTPQEERQEGPPPQTPPMSTTCSVLLHPSSGPCFFYPQLLPRPASIHSYCWGSRHSAGAPRRYHHCWGSRSSAAQRRIPAGAAATPPGRGGEPTMARLEWRRVCRPAPPPGDPTPRKTLGCASACCSAELRLPEERRLPDKEACRVCGSALSGLLRPGPALGRHCCCSCCSCC